MRPTEPPRQGAHRILDANGRVGTGPPSQAVGTSWAEAETDGGRRLREACEEAGIHLVNTSHPGPQPTWYGGSAPRRIDYLGVDLAQDLLGAMPGSVRGQRYVYTQGESNAIRMASRPFANSWRLRRLSRPRN